MSRIDQAASAVFAGASMGIAADLFLSLSAPMTSLAAAAGAIIALRADERLRGTGERSGDRKGEK